MEYLINLFNYCVEHKVLMVILAIELFPLYVMLSEINAKIKYIIFAKALKSKKVENRVASYLYFMRDLGPNTSSFTIVTLIASIDNEKPMSGLTVFLLTVIFFTGIIIKERSRTYINRFYEALKKARSSKWDQQSE